MAFNFTEAHLAQLFSLANFSVPSSGMVVFGLRGASPLDESETGFATSHQLRFTGPDYLHMRCTVGLWRPGQDFAVFLASTVPYIEQIKANRENRGENVNQLMSGRFDSYAKGIHGAGHANGGHRALRFDGALPIRRTWDDNDYENDDNYFFHIAYDNIHCSSQINASEPWYSSNGCQVLCGLPESRGNHQERGPWKDFVAAIYGTSQQRFVYALFNGNEAERIATTGTAPRSQTLRYGSSGSLVRDVQRALNAKGYDIGPAGVNGEYGQRVLEAVMAFQKEHYGVGGADGIVGPTTGADLGVVWPAAGVVSHPANLLAGPPVALGLPSQTAAGVNSFTVVQRTDTANSKTYVSYYATPGVGGGELYLGTLTDRNPPRHVYTGLVQRGYAFSLLGPRYDSNALAGQHGFWAHVIAPTVEAESAGYFARINTYDTAYFTFGCYQCAAHTPNENLIELFRALSASSDFASYFPEVEVRSGKLQAKKNDGTWLNLEATATHEWHNFKVLVNFMKWLNPTVDAIESAETEMSARFIHWAISSAEHRNIQVAHAIATAKAKLRYTDKVLQQMHQISLAGRPVEQCVWISDIRHQGRDGTPYNQIAAALASGDPIGALSHIRLTDDDARYVTVKRELDARVTSRVFHGQVYDPNTDSFS